MTRNCIPSKADAKRVAKMEPAIPGAAKPCPKCGLFKVNCICETAAKLAANAGIPLAVAQARVARLKTERQIGQKAEAQPKVCRTQDGARGFFPKIYTRHFDGSVPIGGPLCRRCNDTRHLWTRVDDSMVALCCPVCDPLSKTERARIQRELLRVADTLADLRQPVPV